MIDVIFPYPTFSGELDVKISNLTLDGDRPKSDPIVTDFRIVNLYDHSGDWERAAFDVEISAPQEEVRKFQDDGGSLSLSITALCGPTNLRHVIEMKRSETDLSLWSARAELHRDNFRGKAVLRTALVATINNVPHRPIASAPDWTVHFDQPTSPQLGGTMAVKWENFETTRAPDIATLHNTVSYVVDLDAPTPVLYLNSAFAGLRALFDEHKGRTDADSVLHDSQRMCIARATWTVLFNAAIGGIRPGEDEDEPDWPTADWQCEVLKQLMARIFPDKSEKESLLELLSNRQSVDGLRQVEALVDAEIGELIGANKALRKSLQRLNRKDTNL